MRSMAASRLTDSQKSELVQRFCDGASSNELAAAFGCSPNTVSRTVKAALGADKYEQVKQQRARGVLRSQPIAASATASASDAPAAGASTQGLVAADEAAGEEIERDDLQTQADADAATDGVLPIDDADDFGGDADDDDEELDESDDFIPIAVLPLTLSQEPVQVQPLEAAALPESLYMLVDKTVELQARPVREFTELGVIPPDEEERQALQLFANPRQAKRQCGRTQRVIKMPDPAVLVRRASYLHVKGISRLVVEGTLYALPGAHS
jgi:hypothetical protein